MPDEGSNKLSRMKCLCGFLHGILYDLISPRPPQDWRPTSAPSPRASNLTLVDEVETIHLHFPLEDEGVMRGPTSYLGWNVYMDSYMAYYGLKGPSPSSLTGWTCRDVQFHFTLEGEGLTSIPTKYQGRNVYMGSYMANYDSMIINIMFDVCRNFCKGVGWRGKGSHEMFSFFEFT